MKYMLAIYGNQAGWDAITPDVHERIMNGHQALQRDLTASGEFVGSAGLTTVDARVVRLRDGVPAVTDGPFTEAKEVLAGYYMVDCESLERATEIAGRIVEAEIFPIEVRRVMDGD